jgi:hypothetical protein
LDLINSVGEKIVNAFNLSGQFRILVAGLLDAFRLFAGLLLLVLTV